METNLTPELAQFLTAAVASGKYRDESDVLKEAVRLLQRRDELRAILEVGEKELDAGLGIPAEEAFDWLEQRATELDRQAGESQR